MAGNDYRSVIFLAFANDRDDRARYLRNLPEELRRIRGRLKTAEISGLCEVVVRTNSTIGELLDVFQDPRYRDRIAVFHFGGHAGGYQLLMESTEGGLEFAHAAGLADFMGHQRGLQLVFLNGCSTRLQVEVLLQSGVPAVIATSESIDDSTAMELSDRFYAAVGGGATIGTAYAEAVGAVKAAKSGYLREVYRVDNPSDRWPWDLYVGQGADIVRQWSLPNAAGDPLFGLPPLPTRDLPPTPYRHLEWFRAEEAELFFGRGRQVRSVFELATSTSADPILLLYGESGVGKSSMLAAGLLPRLASSHQVRYARRQRDLGLTETLATALGTHQSESALADAWRAIESEAGQPLVVILDQVEEVYTRPRPKDLDELERFQHALSGIFVERSSRPRGKIVLGFRKEWLADLRERLREGKLPHSTFYLERLDKGGIVEIVKGPAQSERLRMHFRLAIEPGLAELIADDLLEDREAPVAPTLEVLLTKLWRKATERNADAPEFTITVYQELRRKGLLLDDFVEEQLNAIRDWNVKVADSGLALDVLAFHTTPLGTAESRTRAELEAAYSHQRAVLPELLNQAKNLYLLADYTERHGTGAEQAVGARLAHDTLAPLVRRRFEDSDAPGQRARRILENRSIEWQDGRTGDPLDVTDLATVERGAAGMPVWNPDERRLVEASRVRRRNRRWALGGVAAAGLAAVVLIGGLYFLARANEKNAKAQADQALSRALASAARSESQLDLALLLSAQAVRVQPTLEARGALLETLFRPVPRLLGRSDVESRIYDVVFSPDRSILASGNDDGTIRLWSVNTRRQIRRPLFAHKGTVWSVAFSPDGATLASGGQEGDIRLWDVKTGRPTGGPLTGHGASVRSVEFSPDGTVLASGSDDETIRIWDVQSRRQIGNPLTGHAGLVSSVAFSPDSRTLASGGQEGDIRLWDVKARRQVGKPLRGHRGPVLSVAFDPVGTTIASSGDDGTIRLWDVKTGRPSQEPIEAHPEAIESVAFNRDSSTLASASNDGTVRLWDVKTRRPIGEPLKGHMSSVYSVAFSPDGRTLASGGADGSLCLWDIKERRLGDAAIKGHVAPVRELAFGSSGVSLTSVGETIRRWDVTARRAIGDPLTIQSPMETRQPWRVALSSDGMTAASDGNEKSTYVIRLWNVNTGRYIGHLAVPQAPSSIGGVTMRLTWSMAFGPDGMTFASGHEDGSVLLWDVTTRRAIGEIVTGHKGSVWSVAFSPDGMTLASGGEDRTIRLWDVQTREQIGEVLKEHAASVTRMAFSPDGMTLASRAQLGDIRLWDIKKRQGLASPRERALNITSLAFSPDGTTLAAGHGEGSIRFWDVKAGRPIGVTLAGHTGQVRSMAFSPDGRTLASGGDDGDIRIWDGNSIGWAKRACELAGHNLSEDEWKRFLPELKYESTCPGLPPGEGV